MPCHPGEQAVAVLTKLVPCRRRPRRQLSELRLMLFGEIVDRPIGRRFEPLPRRHLGLLRAHFAALRRLTCCAGQLRQHGVHLFLRRLACRAVLDADRLLLAARQAECAFRTAARGLDLSQSLV
jgi:hypothetical protein